MSRLARFLAVSAVLSAMTSLSLFAQSSGTTVPREMMALLLQGSDLDPVSGFDLRLGPAPADFPRELLPAGARIGVSAVGPIGTAVAGSLSSFTAADQPAFLNAVTKAGWVDAVAQPRGLIAVEPGHPLMLCRGLDFATVMFVPREAGGMLFRAAVERDPGRVCVANRVSTFGDVPLPSLRPPSGAESSLAGIGGSLDAMYSSVRLRTTQPVAAIATHYADQLAAAGWKIEGRASEDQTMSVTRLAGSSTSGEAMSGMLVITALGNTSQVDVLLRVVRNTASHRSGAVIR